MRAGFVLALVLAGVVLAQPARTGHGPLVPTEPPKPETTQAVTPDSVAVESPPAAAPTDTTPASVAASVPRKSPGRAVLLSVLIPGGGQVYTGGWWKTLIIAPAELGLAFFAVRDHRSATAALASGDTTGYVRLRDRRNALLWWTGAVMAFSMADAYVSAQMYAFDRQMSFAVGPAVEAGGLRPAPAVRAGVKLGI